MELTKFGIFNSNETKNEDLIKRRRLICSIVNLALSILLCILAFVMYGILEHYGMKLDKPPFGNAEIRGYTITDNKIILMDGLLIVLSIVNVIKRLSYLGMAISSILMVIAISDIKDDVDNYMFYYKKRYLMLILLCIILVPYISKFNINRTVNIAEIKTSLREGTIDFSIIRNSSDKYIQSINIYRTDKFDENRTYLFLIETLDKDGNIIEVNEDITIDDKENVIIGEKYEFSKSIKNYNIESSDEYSYRVRAIEFEEKIVKKDGIETVDYSNPKVVKDDMNVEIHLIKY